MLEKIGQDEVAPVQVDMSIAPSFPFFKKLKCLLIILYLENQNDGDMINENSAFIGAMKMKG